VAAVLILDPDPAVRSLLELLLLRLGHRPIAERAVDEGEKPDLLLLEPDSRLALRHAWRLRQRLPQLPILCVSIASPSEESRDLGPIGHVMKPFRRLEFENALALALRPEVFEARV